MSYKYAFYYTHLEVMGGGGRHYVKLTWGHCKSTLLDIYPEVLMTYVKSVSISIYGNI